MIVPLSWFGFFLEYLVYKFLFSVSVQASIAANTWVVSGSPQTKSNSLISDLYFCADIVSTAADIVYQCVFRG